MREIGIEIPLGRIAGLRWGEPGAPKVLALHGWLDNAASFIPLAQHLRGLDLVAIDQPGHGRSAHLAAGADYSFVGAINAILDVADALGWERFAFLGHSMGAGIASMIAAACPQRIERLVAIEALGALAETPGRTVVRMREAVAANRALKDKRLRVFPDLDTAVRARTYASRVPGSGLDESLVRLLVERGVRRVAQSDQGPGYEWSSDPRLTLPTMTRMTEPQVEDLVAGIECPVRAIFADPAQPYLPDELRRRRVALLPQGELIVIPGGHHLHMQAPGAVAEAIGGFFQA
ncbi:alpha/beta fold hydrolase [Thermomonas aquatica]|uniref:Alpha/beta hydrolase n=1 Tax=Thermomonas aquatica TaxID=2202149 RepID=A0A5B7ZSF7_9GAMM|nr:alpha/beta hydrolase [Thermomonas aquatica]QDA57426.1 alpha/beta hydrolase [Thermomonas aquatica]